MTQQKEADVWLVQVFGSQSAAGNPTGIVMLEAEIPRPTQQRMASRLGYPDTGFVFKPTISTAVSMLSFSPAEELKFCSQTTLALGAVLAEIDYFASRRSANVLTVAGAVHLERDSRRANRFWTTIPAPAPGKLESSEAIGSLLGIPANDLKPQVKIGFGRQRAYVQLTDVGNLYANTPLPSHVMDFCKAHDVNAVCPFVEVAPGEILIRVFTTSLLGREDAATGGAVAAVPAYLRAIGQQQDVAEWQIDQGSGPAIHRGRIYVKELEPGDRIAIGGDTRLISSGTVFNQAWEL